MKLTSYADWFFVGVLSLVAVVAMTSVESALGVVLPISGIGATDTEVDQVYFDALKPSIARAYHLDYDQAECNTSIKQGYFWRERDEAYRVAAN